MRSLHSAKSVRVKLYNGDEIAFIPDGVDGASANKRVKEIQNIVDQAKGGYINSELAGVSFAVNYVASIRVAEPKYISLADDDTNGWSTRGKYDLLPGEILVKIDGGRKVYVGIPADIDYHDSKILVYNNDQVVDNARPVINQIKEKYPVIVDNLNKVLFGYNESEGKNV